MCCTCLSINAVRTSVIDIPNCFARLRKASYVSTGIHICNALLSLLLWFGTVEFYLGVIIPSSKKLDFFRFFASFCKFLQAFAGCLSFRLASVPHASYHSSMNPTDSQNLADIRAYLGALYEQQATGNAGKTPTQRFVPSQEDIDIRRRAYRAVYYSINSFFLLAAGTGLIVLILGLVNAGKKSGLVTVGGGFALLAFSLSLLYLINKPREGDGKPGNGSRGGSLFKR